LQTIGPAGEVPGVLAVKNDSKANMTLMFTCAADGTLLPPMFVFKADNLYENWLRNAPAGSGFETSASGWMSSKLMESWLHQVVIPYANSLENDELRLLLIDNFG
jgi:hypothetical protein